METKAGENCEVKQAKEEIKRINICSIIFGIIGLGVGIFITLSEGIGFDDPEAIGGLIAAIWIGIGIGGGIVSLFQCFSFFPRVFKEEGFSKAFKLSIGGGILFLIFFTFTGPIGWLIRVIKRKKTIKSFKNQ